MAGGYDNEDVQAELEEIRRRQEREAFRRRDEARADADKAEPRTDDAGKVAAAPQRPRPPTRRDAKADAEAALRASLTTPPHNGPGAGEDE